MKIYYCGVHKVLELCNLNHECPYTMLYHLREFNKVWGHEKCGIFIREDVSRNKIAAFFRLTEDELVPFIVTKDEVWGNCPNVQEIRKDFFVRQES